MNEREFKARTKDIALRVIRLVDSLPSRRSSEVIGKQLLRSGTSIGACLGKSTADVINKLAIVEEEADESLYWIELSIDGGLVTEKKLAKLYSDY